MTQPLVTVNILSFNRRDDLRVTLQKVYEQDYKNIEVIVVDNASSDGTVEMVKSEFPVVRLIELKTNIGISGWNEGFKIAKGEFVMVLDDNAYPDVNAIGLCVEEFLKSTNVNVACIALNIFDLIQNSIWVSNWQSKEKNSNVYFPVFVGCAAVFDAKKIQLNNLMPAKYFIYQHELPVSSEIHRNNLRILFNPRIMAYHTFTGTWGYSQQRDILLFKNNLYFILEDLPFWLIIPYALQSILYFGTRSIKRGWSFEFIKAFREVMKKFDPKTGMSLQYFFELRRLHLFNYSLVSKIQFRISKLSKRLY
ncbi:MAG: glycosyltransferase [Bacteroidota bacterium]|nr:glycosyltransferase [Bacteroidota bacterium]